MVRVAGRVRGFETVGDMVRSLAVVGVFVVVILLDHAARRRRTRSSAVDTAPVRRRGRRRPPRSPPTSRARPPRAGPPTSARVSAARPTRPYSWYVGYSTDTEAFVAVTQVYGDPDGVPARRSAPAGASADGTVRDRRRRPGRRSSDADGTRRALVRTGGPGRRPSSSARRRTRCSRDRAAAPASAADAPADTGCIAGDATYRVYIRGMSIRHGLLALLQQGPMYGYQLRAEFESRTGAHLAAERRAGLHDPLPARA